MAARSSVPDRDASGATGDDSLFELLWQVAAYAHLMADAALADTPLTAASSSMLFAVADEPGITVAEVSRRLPKTQQALSQVVARLEKLGLVERRLGPGRGVGLYVTDAGCEMAKVAARCDQQVAEQLGELLGERRSAALAKVLSETRAILRDARA